MLQLTANGNTLDIRNASFNLTLKSPLAGENAGSYVFSLTIPYTPTNARAFGFPFRLTRMQVLTATAEARIIYGIHVQQGQWKAKTSTAKSISLEMVIGSGHFNTLVDGKKLPEYFDVESDLGEYMISHINTRVTMSYPSTNYQFPCIYNPSFYGEVNETFSGVINDYADGFIDDIANYTNIVPQMYLLYVVVHLFESQLYTANGNVLDDTYLQKALLYNNFAIDKVLATYFSASAFMDLIRTPYVVLWDTNIVDPQSNYTSLAGKYNVDSAGTYNIQVDINCKLNEEGDQSSIQWLVIQIMYDTTVISNNAFTEAAPLFYSEYSVNFNYNISQSSINKDLYVKVFYADGSYNPYEAFVQFGHIKIINTSSPKLNVFGNIINYKNHVPDMGVKEFLKEFYASAKILPFFNHRKKTVELVFLRDLLESIKQEDLSEGLVRDTLKIYDNDYKGLTFKFDFQGPDKLLENNFIVPETVKDTIEAYDDLPEYPAVGDTYFITALNCWYEYQYIEPENDEDPGIYKWVGKIDDHFDVVYDDGQEEICTSMAPMMMRVHTDPETGYIRNMPAIDAKGTSEAYSLKGSFPLRIMFWVGLKEGVPIVVDPNPPEYPMASTTKYDTDFNIVLEISHKLAEIITRYFVPVIAWYKRRQKIEFTNLVTPAFIANLDFQNKFYFQKTKVLFEEVVVKIKSKVFGPGRFRGWG